MEVVSSLNLNDIFKGVESLSALEDKISSLYDSCNRLQNISSYCDEMTLNDLMNAIYSVSSNPDLSNAYQSILSSFDLSDPENAVAKALSEKYSSDNGEIKNLIDAGNHSLYAIAKENVNYIYNQYSELCGMDLIGLEEMQRRVEEYESVSGEITGAFDFSGEVDLDLDNIQNVEEISELSKKEVKEKRDTKAHFQLQLRSGYYHGQSAETQIRLRKDAIKRLYDDIGSDDGTESPEKATYQSFISEKTRPYFQAVENLNNYILTCFKMVANEIKSRNPSQFFHAMGFLFGTNYSHATKYETIYKFLTVDETVKDILGFIQNEFSFENFMHGIQLNALFADVDNFDLTAATIQENLNAAFSQEVEAGIYSTDYESLYVGTEDGNITNANQKLTPNVKDIALAVINSDEAVSLKKRSGEEIEILNLYADYVLEHEKAVTEFKKYHDVSKNFFGVKSIVDACENEIETIINSYADELDKIRSKITNLESDVDMYKQNMSDLRSKLNIDSICHNNDKHRIAWNRISNGESNLFKTAIRDINSGVLANNVIEKINTQNPSLGRFITEVQRRGGLTFKATLLQLNDYRINKEKLDNIYTLLQQLFNDETRLQEAINNIREAPFDSLEAGSRLHNFKKGLIDKASFPHNEASMKDALRNCKNMENLNEIQRSSALLRAEYQLDYNGRKAKLKQCRIKLIEKTKIERFLFETGTSQDFELAQKFKAALTGSGKSLRQSADDLAKALVSRIGKSALRAGKGTVKIGTGALPAIAAQTVANGISPALGEVVNSGFEYDMFTAGELSHGLAGASNWLRASTVTMLSQRAPAILSSAEAMAAYVAALSASAKAGSDAILVSFLSSLGVGTSGATLTAGSILFELLVFILIAVIIYVAVDYAVGSLMQSSRGAEDSGKFKQEICKFSTYLIEAFKDFTDKANKTLWDSNRDLYKAIEKEAFTHYQKYSVQIKYHTVDGTATFDYPNIKIENSVLEYLSTFNEDKFLSDVVTKIYRTQENYDNIRDSQLCATGEVIMEVPAKMTTCYGEAVGPLKNMIYASAFCSERDDNVLIEARNFDEPKKEFIYPSLSVVYGGIESIPPEYEYRYGEEIRQKNYPDAPVTISSEIYGIFVLSCWDKYFEDKPFDGLFECTHDVSSESEYRLCQWKHTIYELSSANPIPLGYLFDELSDCSETLIPGSVKLKYKEDRGDFEFETSLCLDIERMGCEYLGEAAFWVEYDPINNTGIGWTDGSLSSTDPTIITMRASGSWTQYNVVDTEPPGRVYTNVYSTEVEIMGEDFPYITLPGTSPTTIYDESSGEYFDVEWKWKCYETGDVYSPGTRIEIPYATMPPNIQTPRLNFIVDIEI